MSNRHRPGPAPHYGNSASNGQKNRMHGAEFRSSQATGHLLEAEACSYCGLRDHSYHCESCWGGVALAGKCERCEPDTIPTMAAADHYTEWSDYTDQWDHKHMSDQ